MPMNTAFLPLRRRAPAVAEIDLPCVRRGTAVAPPGDTRQRVDSCALATPGSSQERFFGGAADHGAPPEPPVSLDLNREKWGTRWACLGIALVLSLLVDAPQRLILALLEACR